jgi:ferredoxin
VRLHVNPITCTGHGMCAELLPEMISLDPWGYPILTPEDGQVPRRLAAHARRAVGACPTLALLTGAASATVGRASSAADAGRKAGASLVPAPGVRGGRRNPG